MAKTIRTQAMRALDARKIAYTVHQFPENIHDAEQVAALLNRVPGEVFKTLVLIREDDPRAHPLLYMVPADSEVDVRQFAKALGVKSVRMATHEQAEKLTGLKVGGISALALLNKPFVMYLDSSAQSFREIFVSAGQRGVDIQISVSDLQRVTGAQTVQATRAKL
ncbi:MAG TPA: aminoacyl-tRNA deacylase [Ktedonobacteraceae bacterium]|jgi:Cys-tRNA(Pro)/Cys-tRNA(Cys) deacylase|nr:aminoacyl-tRNA deacylase [Ktedonobacteraceae bacterium]